MAEETDPVQIVVEIIDGFSDEIRELKAKLESLEMKDIDIDLDIKDNGEIASTAAKLEALDQMDVSPDIDVGSLGGGVFGPGDTDDFVDDMVRDHLQSMTRRETGSSVVPPPGMARGDFVEPIDFADGGAAARNDFFDSIRDMQHRADKAVDSEGGIFGDALFGDLEAQAKDAGAMMDDIAARPDGDRDGSPLLRAMMRADAMDMGEFGLPRGPGTDLFGRRRGFDWVEETSEGFEDFGKVLREFQPNIMMWWNILALLLPIIISLAGAAVGFAAALGAITIAATSIIGLGLIGWGDNFTESLQNAKEAAMELGKRLFDVFQPAAMRFQPVVERWMEGLPRQAERLVQPMAELIVFTDELESVGAGIIDWLVMVISSLDQIDDIAGQLSIRIGEAFGTFIHNALMLMLKDVHKNQDAYMKLGEILLQGVLALFNFVKAIGFVLAEFQPLLDMLVFLTSLLDHRFVVALGMVIATVILLETALGALGTMLAFVRGGFIANAGAMLASYLPSLTATISKVWALVTALGALRSALLLSGVGAALVIGGFALDKLMGATGGGRIPSDRRDFRNSGGGNTYINIEGDVRRREMDRLMDRVGGTARSEIAINESMEGI